MVGRSGSRDIFGQPVVPRPSACLYPLWRCYGVSMVGGRWKDEDVMMTAKEPKRFNCTFLHTYENKEEWETSVGGNAKVGLYNVHFAPTNPGGKGGGGDRSTRPLSGE